MKPRLSRLIIIVDERHILELMNKIPVGDTGAVFLFSEAGELLVSNNGINCTIDRDTAMEYAKSQQSNQIDGNEFAITSITCSNGWECISFVPQELFLADVNRLGFFTIICTLLLSVVGVLFVFVFNYRSAISVTHAKRVAERWNAKIVPQRKRGFRFWGLKGAMNFPASDRGMYATLESLITGLVQDNTAQNTTILTQQTRMQEQALCNLLYGFFNDAQSMSQQLVHNKILFRQPYIAVMLISVPCAQLLADISHTRAEMTSELSRQMQTEVYGYFPDEETFVFVVSISEQEMCKSDRTAVEVVMESFADEYSIELYGALGAAYSKIEKVHLSYTQTKRIAMTFDQTSCCKLKVLTTQPISEYYHYPVDLEIKLIAAVHHGTEEELSNVLRRLYLENFKHRSISDKEEAILFTCLTGTIIRIQQSCSLPDLGMLLMGTVNIHTILGQFMALHELIAGRRHANSSDKEHHMLKKILAHIIIVSSNHSIVDLLLILC